MCIWLCTIVLHNTAQNSSDNIPSYRPDNHHNSDVLYWMREGQLTWEVPHLCRFTRHRLWWLRQFTVCQVWQDRSTLDVRQYYPLHTTIIPWHVKLSWLENAYSRPLFEQAIMTHKLGQSDLVFGTQSGFTTRSVHTRLQVSVCSSYDMCHPG